MNTNGVINMRNRTVRLDREGDYWTKAEKEALVEQFQNGAGITEMAIYFQRTEPAIMQQIEKMDLYRRKDAPKRRKSCNKPRGCLCGSCDLDPELCPHTAPCSASKEG